MLDVSFFYKIYELESSQCSERDSDGPELDFPIQQYRVANKNRPPKHALIIRFLQTNTKLIITC